MMQVNKVQDLLRLSNDTEFHPEDLTIVSRSVSTILLRVGFVLVQIGSIPITNVNLIILQNIVDVCFSSLVFFLLGLIVAYNGDHAGLIGGGYWIGDQEIDKDRAVIGWQVVLISSAISTSAIAGRTHVIGNVLVSFILSGLVQPLAIHWIWTSKGWMAENELAGKRVVFRDYSGASTVHLVGGLTALVGCWTLGRRILRLRDLDEASIGSNASGSGFAGQLLIYAGLLGLSTPNHELERPRDLSKSTSNVLVNNFLASSSCALLAAALHFVLNRESLNHWTVMRCSQAIIAGLVTISAGANVYSPLASIGLGCLGGIAFHLVSSHIFRSPIEDYGNVIATHLTCSIIGIILAPLCTPLSEAEDLRIELNFSWHLICLITLITLVTSVMTIVFVPLDLCGVLRNRSEHLNHTRAMGLLDKGPRRNFHQRLFVPDEDAILLEPTLPSGNEEKVPRLLKYRGDIDNDETEKEEGREGGGGGVVKAGNDNGKVVQAPGLRVKKLRQVHTLPSCDLQESMVSGSLTVDVDQALEVGVEYFKMDASREDALARKIWMSEGDLKCNPIQTGDTGKIVEERLNYSDETTSVGNYKLRRTFKSINLRKDIEDQDSKFEVLLKPKSENWSTDSQEGSLVECN